MKEAASLLRAILGASVPAAEYEHADERQYKFLINLQIYWRLSDCNSLDFRLMPILSSDEVVHDEKLRSDRGECRVSMGERRIE